MKQVTIHIPDNRFSFFMELIKSLKFVKKVDADEETSKKQILQGLRDAVEEVNLIKSGKQSAQLLREFLDEL